MELWVSRQAFEFALSMVLGAGLGVLYDILSLIRAVFRRGWLVTAVADLLFCLFVAVTLFLFNLIFVSGILRWYIVLGCAGGASIYFLTLSRVFRVLAHSITVLVRGLFSRFPIKKSARESKGVSLPPPK